MEQLLYDGSFEGLLTAIFDVYERKLQQVRILKKGVHLPDLYASASEIVTDKEKASRVWNGLKRKLSTEAVNHFYKSFLSELDDMEDTLLSFTQYILSSPEGAERDFSHKAVLKVAQVSKQVHREKHRMEAFVRFQRTADDLYYAVIEPDFNVLPLIAKHFKDRYADQAWIIYDTKRKYGIHYDNKDNRVSEIVPVFTEDGISRGTLSDSMVHEHEPAYQTLWKDYFRSVNITDRKNMKLHLRHIPTRYWRHLTEKH
jgi:probable DNA metabolism protein